MAAPTTDPGGGGYGDLIRQAAAAHNVPAAPLLAISQQESGGDPDATGQPTKYGVGKGLFQFMPDTAKRYGIDPTDPAQSADAAARMFSDNLTRFGGDQDKAIAAHFAGPDTKQWGPKTTQYVKDVNSRMGALGLPNAPASKTSPILNDAGDVVGQGPANAAPSPADPFDQWRSQGWGTVTPDQPEPPGPKSTTENVARVIGSGATQIPEVVGTGLSWLGRKIGSTTVEDIGDSAKDYWHDFGANLVKGTSPEVQQALNNPLLTDDFHLGDTPVATAVWGSLQMLPSLAAMAVPGAGAASVASRAAMAIPNVMRGTEALAAAARAGRVLTAAEVPDAAAAKVAGYVARGVGFGGSQGVYMGLQAGDNTERTVNSMGFSQLQDSPAFNKAWDSTDESLPGERRFELARSQVAKAAGDQAAAATFAGTGIFTAVLGGGGLAQFVNPLKGGLARRVTLGAAAEAGSMAAMMGGQQYVENKALQIANPNISSTAGMPNAMAMGLTAAPFGAVGGLHGAAPDAARATGDQADRAAPATEGERASPGAGIDPWAAGSAEPLSQADLDRQASERLAGVPPQEAPPPEQPGLTGQAAVDARQQASGMQDTDVGKLSGGPFLNKGAAGFVARQRGLTDSHDITQIGDNAFVLRPKPETEAAPASEAATPAEASVAPATGVDTGTGEIPRAPAMTEGDVGDSNGQPFTTRKAASDAATGKGLFVSKIGDDQYVLRQESKASGKLPAAETVDAAAHEAATSPKNETPEPTDAQKEAGNYQKGHVSVGGLDVSVENPAGSQRRPEWPVLKSHYGYIKGTEGNDSEHVDTFVKTGTPEDYNGPVHVIDQNKSDGSFDEHKVMIGWKNATAARRAYLENYTKGWNGLGALHETNMDGLKDWLANGDTKKPFGETKAGTSENPAAIEAAKPEAPATEVGKRLALHLKALGGLDIREASDTVGETGMRARRMLPGLFRNTVRSDSGFISGGHALSTLVHEGRLDDYLPPEMRPGSERYDEDESVQHVRDLLNRDLAQKDVGPHDQRMQREIEASQPAYNELSADEKPAHDAIVEDVLSKGLTDEEEDKWLAREASEDDTGAPSEGVGGREGNAEAQASALEREPGADDDHAALSDEAKAEAQSKAADEGPLYSRKPSKYTDDEQKAVLEGYRALAAHDDAFQFGKSKSKDLQTIAKDLAPEKSTPFHVQVNEEAAFGKPEVVKGWVITDPRNPEPIKLTQYDDGKLELDISQMDRGGGGSQVYAIVSQFAKNNGLKFTGDRAGFSKAAFFRRTENMQSAALRHGTTEHIAPHEDQGKEQLAKDMRASPLDWTEGDHEGNTFKLLVTGMENVERHLPGVKNFAYDFDRGEFVSKITGARADPDRFGDFGFGPSGEPNLAREGYFGRSTVARAIFTRSLLRTVERSDVPLEMLHVLGSKPLPDDLKRILYSVADQAPERGLSVSDVEKRATEATKGWADAPGLKFHQSVDDLRKEPGFKDAPDDARGAFHDGTLHMVADNLKDERDVDFTLGHEAFHYALEKDPEYQGALRSIFQRNQNIRKAAAAWKRDNPQLAGESPARYQLRSINEAMADLAGSGKPFSGLKQVVVAAQKVLRSVGLHGVADWLEHATDAEALGYIAKLQNSIQRGDKPAFYGGGEAAPAFSEKPPVWRSGLSEAVAAKAPFGKDGTVQSEQLGRWLDARTKDGTVKKDELEWSGLPEYLKTQGGRVSRDDVQQFLDQNGVRVKDTTLGEEPSPESREKWQTEVDRRVAAARAEHESENEREYDRIMYHWEGDGHHVIEIDPETEGGDDKWGVTHRDAGVGDVETFKTEEEAQAAADKYNEAEGAEAERHVRSQLPDFDEDSVRAEAQSDVADEMEDEGSTGATQYHKYVLPGGENYREMLLKLPDARSADTAARITEIGKQRDALARDRDPVTNVMRNESLWHRLTDEQDRLAREDDAAIAGQFRAPHFGEEGNNLLAHIRFNDRTDAEGKKVLFLEELQSDWAQKGRKSGFKTGADQRFQALKSEVEAKYGKSMIDLRSEREPSDEVKLDLARIDHAYGAAQEEKHGNAVPNAPFVGKTEAWTALALKRMIRHAAENGYDKIAWTNGDQQADRYSLAKQVDKISWARNNATGSRMVSIDLKGGSDVTFKIDKDGKVEQSGRNAERLLGQKLEDIVGKEVADKIVSASSAHGGELAGEGLKIGGEGMKGYYDKLLPQVANKVLKGLGGGEVGDVNIKTGNAPDDVVARHPDNEPFRKANTLQPQSGFDITPAMREKALQGMPMFSRSGEGTAPASTDMFDRARESARDIFDAVAHSDRSLPRWRAGVQTPFDKANAMTKGGDYKNPGYKRVFDSVQSYLRDSQMFSMDAADKAPDVLPRLENLTDVFKRGPASDDMKAATKALFDGTVRDKKVYNDAELNAMGMSERGKGYYRQMRDAFDQSLDDHTASIAGLLSQDSGIPASVVKEAREDPGNARTIYSDAYKPLVTEMNRRIDDAKGYMKKWIDDQMAAEHAEIAELPPVEKARVSKDLARRREGQQLVMQSDIDKLELKAQNLNAAYGAIIKQFDRVKTLKSEGYAPLMRFGEHTVYAYDPETGKQISFSGHENQLAGNREAARLRAEHPEAEVVQGLMSHDAEHLYEGLSPEAIKLFAKVLGEKEGGDAGDVQRMLYQDYLKVAAGERSPLKRMIYRKGVPGYSEDVHRVLSAFVASNARAASRNYHALDMKEALGNIPKEHGDVYTDASKLVDYVMRPKPEANAVRNLLFMNFLGGSVVSALNYTTQVPLLTLPHLTQFASLGRATKAMSYGMKVGLKGADNEPLRGAMARATREGMLKPLEMHMLYAEQAGRGGVINSLPYRKFARVWGGLFQAVEAYNRRATFAAAWQMGNEMTPAQLKEAKAADAYGFAKNAVDNTQFVYNKGNRPNWFRGPVGATLGTFKMFMISYAELLNRLPMPQKALALSLLTAGAGVQGLPFADNIEDLIDAVGQTLGWNTNSKEWMHQKAAGVLGKTAGDVFNRGLSAIPGSPVDMSARIGLGHIIPGLAALKPSEKDRWRDLRETLGPVGALADQGLKTLTALQEGRYGDAAQAVAPKAVRNLAQGVQEAKTGTAVDARGRPTTPVSGAGTVAQMLGFTPYEVGKANLQEFGAQQDISMVKDVQGRIADRWARGMVDGDKDEIAAAKAELEDWNTKNPDSKVIINSATLMQRVRDLRQDRAARLVRTAPKQMRGDVRAELNP